MRYLASFYGFFLVPTLPRGNEKRIGLIAAALYFQYAIGLEPCPLCIVQRVAFMGVGGFFCLGFYTIRMASGGEFTLALRV